MNTLLLSLTFAALFIAMYLLIARLSRKDERGRQLWRKLITPTPLDAFSSSEKDVAESGSSHSPVVVEPKKIK